MPSCFVGLTACLYVPHRHFSPSSSFSGWKYSFTRLWRCRAEGDVDDEDEERAEELGVNRGTLPVNMG
jgi:hypothetical protein